MWALLNTLPNNIFCFVLYIGAFFNCFASNDIVNNDSDIEQELPIRTESIRLSKHDDYATFKPAKAVTSNHITYIKDAAFMYSNQCETIMYTLLDSKTKTIRTTLNNTNVLEITCFVKKESAIRYVGRNPTFLEICPIKYGQLLMMTNLNNNIALKVVEDA